MANSASLNHNTQSLSQPLVGRAMDRPMRAEREGKLGKYTFKIIFTREDTTPPPVFGYIAILVALAGALTVGAALIKMDINAGSVAAGAGIIVVSIIGAAILMKREKKENDEKQADKEKYNQGIRAAREAGNPLCEVRLIKGPTPSHYDRYWTGVRFSAVNTYIDERVYKLENPRNSN
jgi:hypothetical protein